MSEYEKDIVRTSTQHVSDVISMNKELTEKTLRMRCQSYQAHVKSQLLTQTVYEISSSKKILKKLNKDLLDNNVKLKRQQEIIAEQKEEWERSFNALSSQVCILDMSGTILRANKAMRDRFEARHGTIIGMDYRLIYYGTTTADPRCPCTEVLSGSSDKISVETSFPTMDGWYQESLYSLHDSSGKQCGAVSAVEDITERKKMEEELVKMQKLKSVGILAGGIAHDFNNSLQGILSIISLAETFANPED
jgi:PAS domain S-box-containing protein